LTYIFYTDQTISIYSRISFLELFLFREGEQLFQGAGQGDREVNLRGGRGAAPSRTLPLDKILALGRNDIQYPL